MTNNSNGAALKRFTALLLCAVIAVSTAACSGSSDGSSNSQTTSADNADAAETTSAEQSDDMFTQRASVSDDLPTMDYAGADFTILVYGQVFESMTVEELSGDVVDDAIYNRNITVSDRFGVNLKFIDGGDYSASDKLLTTSVNAGDDEYQLVANHVVNTASLALEGYYLNWYDIPYVDFSRPWWSESTSNDLSYNGKCPLAVGDFALTAIMDTYCVFYNKTLAENYQIPNIYDVVNDGSWTFDYLTTLTKDIYVDLDGDGAESEGDFYGFATDCRSNVNTYLWAFDNPIISKNSAGELEVTYRSNKINNIVETLVNAFANNPGMSAVDSWGWNVGTNLFSESRDVFANGILNAASGFRDLEDDYGIIPYPKWDEAQENYYTMVDGAHCILGIPVTVADTERAGIITEALNSESYKTVVPSFYQTALKDKYARDEESLAMIDLVVSSRYFDMGYIYDGWKGCSFFLQHLIANNNTNFESFWASKESSVTEWYNKVIAYFSE